MSRLWKGKTQLIFRVQTKEFLITGSTEDHNEELNDLYSSPNIVRVTSSRRFRWAVHVARMGEKRGYTGFWWGNLRERDRLGDPGIDGSIILAWSFKKWYAYGLDRSGSG
jgi:hypothetical protein